MMSNAAYLTAAKEALHQLLIGKSVRVVQKDGRRVEYTPTDRPALERYIRSLEGASRRPMGIC